MHVDMKGRALFFKTISEQQDEVHSDFQPVPDNLTLAQAAAKLDEQAKRTTEAVASTLDNSAKN